MKVFERNKNKDMVVPKRELAQEISEVQKSSGLRWRVEIKARLREKYRHKKASSMKLAGSGLSEKELPVIKIALLAQGSIQKRYNTCGKKDCPCMKDPRKKHGPYWYLSLPIPVSESRGGWSKMKHFYVSKTEADKLRVRIQMYRRLVKQVWFELYDDFENGTVVDDMIESGGEERGS